MIKKSYVFIFLVTIFLSALFGTLESSSGCESVGLQRALVIAVNYQDDTYEDVPITTLYGMFFDATDSLADLLDQSSYGKVSLTGDTLGWYTLPINSDEALCDDSDSLHAIRDMALARAYEDTDLTQYDRVFIIMRNPPVCWFAGTTGAPGNSPDGSVVGCTTIYAKASLYADPNPPIVGIALSAHELGHGLHSAHAWGRDYNYNDQPESIGPIGGYLEGTLSKTDQYDLMGNFLDVGQYNAHNKYKLGWLEDSDITRVNTNGTFTIEPLSSPLTGIKAIRIFRGVDTATFVKEYLWVETRQPIGYDIYLDSRGYDGALFHHEHFGTSSAPSITEFIDMHPETSDRWYDSPLYEGESFYDPYAGINISHDGITVGDLKLTVSVSYDEDKIDLDEDGLSDTTEGIYGTNANAEDSDGDGMTDLQEVCFDGDCTSYNPYPGGGDTNALDPDTDGDSLSDGDEVNVYGTDPTNNDTDGDGHGDGVDNCPNTYNPDQSDIDGDGIGDLCDSDDDNDGIDDTEDNCPLTYNPDQSDIDGDGIGDLCDSDDDNDGIDDTEDNCPLIYNPDQSDIDGDGIGDVCDLWYDTDWLYRQKISISSNMTVGDQSDFPLLIKLTDAGNGVFANAQTDGDDIVFTLSDGTTKLDHEIERYDSTAGNEGLEAWVKILALSSSVDTEIYIYYGNSTVSSQENPEGVWDSNYRGVWHLKEESAGTGNPDLYQDSTINNNDGDDYVSAVGQEGQINGGQEFDGADDYIAVPDSASLKFGTGDFTVSLWAKLDNSGANQYLINKYPGGGVPGFHISMSNTDGVFWVMEHGDTLDFSVYGTTPINDSVWHYLTYVRNSGTGVRELWVDGVQQASVIYGINDIDTTDRMIISGAYTIPSVAWTQGGLDEVRISSQKARSGDWIQTSYNNQKDFAIHTGFGLEENPDFMTITATSGTDGSISPSGDVIVDYGADQRFSFRSSRGYQISDVLVDGVSVSLDADNSYTFTNVTANHTISVTFEIITYTITATAGTGGSISPSGDVTVDYAAEQTFTITADTEFEISDVLVDGASVSLDADNTYTFTGVTADHTISAAFVDTTPPDVIITYPQPNATVPGGGFDFTGTARDASGVAEVRIYVYDYGLGDFTVRNELAAYDPGTEEWSFPVLPSHITLGQAARLYVRAIDNAGNGTVWNTVLVNVDDWYDTNWSNRQKISISSNMTVGDQSDFPLLIKLTDAGNGVFVNAQTDGDDIVFTLSDGTTKLDHEIERYDSTAGNEGLEAWVKILALSSSVDTEIYIYYGNSTVSSQENPEGVWDSNYRGVWHLKEESAGTGNLDLYQDSTINNNDGDDYVSAVGQEGQINGGQEFDGADDYIAVPDSASLKFGTGDFTVSLWAKLDNSGANQYLINKYPGGGVPGFHISMSNTDGVFWVMEHGDTLDFSVYGTTPINDSVWHYLTYVRNSGTGVRELWVDGVQQASVIYGINDIDTTDRMIISGAYTIPSVAWTQGGLDEVRISSQKARSGDWIQTSYNNQKYYLSYTGFGTEETAPN